MDSTGSAPAHARELRFKQCQQAIDGLINEAETLVMTGADKVPAGLAQRASEALADIFGRVPPWFSGVTSPEPLLNHLFVAEGTLRQRFYGIAIDLEDTD
ncbi:MAG TPA: hypothetical protein VFR33_14870 [Candidatus Dormibacteraeota bacterium]|nr:hypothetical protein [Candidatus Dormibacteraeota bacterium]